MSIRASPAYIFGVASESMVSAPFGSRVTTVVPSLVAFRRITHHPAPSVAAAVNVCVIAAVMSMTLPRSATPRIVFDALDS